MNSFALSEKYIKELILSTFGIEVEAKIALDPKGLSCEVAPANKQDRGLLIGYKGENIGAIRRLARIWGKRNNVSLHVFLRFDYQ